LHFAKNDKAGLIIGAVLIESRCEPYEVAEAEKCKEALQAMLQCSSLVAKADWQYIALLYILSSAEITRALEQRLVIVVSEWM
jgi:hypothetical protein